MADNTGECPHCGVGVQFVVHLLDKGLMPHPLSSSHTSGALEQLNKYSLVTKHCPLCRKPIIYLSQPSIGPPPDGRPAYYAIQIYPQRVTREPPVEVENKEIRQDYTEAAATAQTSLRGAAALARRALQGALREKGFTHSSNKLYKEIEIAAASPSMPTELVEKLHFLRDVGNDGAHPNFDDAGETIDVEPGDFALL